MKVVIAIDSFKGSVSSLEAGEAAKNGVLDVYPEADVSIMPLADGGEGTVETLVYGLGGELVRVDGNRDPHLGLQSRPVVKGDGTSACIAAAIGIIYWKKRTILEYPMPKLNRELVDFFLKLARRHG